MRIVWGASMLFAAVAGTFAMATGSVLEGFGIYVIALVLAMVGLIQKVPTSFQLKIVVAIVGFMLFLVGADPISARLMMPRSTPTQDELAPLLAGIALLLWAYLMPDRWKVNLLQLIALLVAGGLVVASYFAYRSGPDFVWYPLNLAALFVGLPTVIWISRSPHSNLEERR